MSIGDGETTVLTAATTVSKSLRTTIPAGIVRQFSLMEGDKIQWKMEVKDNELVIIARPVKNTSNRG
jgi:bifunctional DNA-binding transcriptional regulator/antitoxin component of YhaV-PrlF toxin-antitoxin module